MLEKQQQKTRNAMCTCLMFGIEMEVARRTNANDKILCTNNVWRDGESERASERNKNYYVSYAFPRREYI